MVVGTQNPDKHQRPMKPPNRASIGKNIPGVSIKHIDGVMEFYFLKPLDYDEWHEVENHISGMLKDGQLHFTFFLQLLSHFNSTDIGMWVTLNAKIENANGRLKLFMGKDSPLHKYVQYSRLDKILTIQLVDPSQDTS